MNKFLNRCKISRIPPLFVQDKFITNSKEKASVFNKYFSSQCTPILNNSELPELRLLTNSRISTFDINLDEINDIITGLDVKPRYVQKRILGPKCPNMVIRPQNSRKVKILKIVTITRIALEIRFQQALNHYLEIILSRNMSKNVFWASNAQIW